MQSYTTDIETCQTESDRLTEELKQCSSSHDSLEPTGHIGISIIRQVENARETDVCIGTSTSVGYITSKSCCQADEISSLEGLAYLSRTTSNHILHRLQQHGSMGKESGC